MRLEAERFDQTSCGFELSRLKPIKQKQQSVSRPARQQQIEQQSSLVCVGNAKPLFKESHIVNVLLVTSHNLLVNSALDSSLFLRCSNLVVLQSSWSVQDLLQSINGIFLLHKLSAAFLSFCGCFRCGFPDWAAISSQNFRTNHDFSIRMQLRRSYFELYDALVVL